MAIEEQGSSEISEERLRNLVRSTLEQLKSEQEKEKEIQELKSTVAGQQKEIINLKSFCDENPDSKLCKIIDTKVNKGFITKATSGETKMTKLPVMNKGIRSEMRPDEIDERTRRAGDMMNSLHISMVDALNVIEEDPVSKKNLPAAIFKEATKDDLVKLYASCSARGDCQQIYGELENRGIRLQFKDGKKGWVNATATKEVREKSHF